MATLRKEPAAFPDAAQTPFFGERVRRFRRQRGLTQLELATKLGLRQPDLSDFERGSRRLHAQLIVDLARMFGISTDELLGFSVATAPDTTIKRPFLRRLRHLDRLSEREQTSLLHTIDGFFARAELKSARTPRRSKKRSEAGGAPAASAASSASPRSRTPRRSRRLQPA